MVPSLLSVFTFYIIAAIAPADAKLQPRAVRHGFLSVRSDLPTGVATHTLAVASTGPTHKEEHLLEENTHTLPHTTNIYCNALAAGVDTTLAVLLSTPTRRHPISAAELAEATTAEIAEAARVQGAKRGTSEPHT